MQVYLGQSGERTTGWFQPNFTPLTGCPEQGTIKPSDGPDDMASQWIIAQPFTLPF